jgi:hypothetical protein
MPAGPAPMQSRFASSTPSAHPRASGGGYTERLIADQLLQHKLMTNCSHRSVRSFRRNGEILGASPVEHSPE